MKRVRTDVSKEVFTETDQLRNEIEILRRRVKLLEGQDRLIMTMYLENGNSIRQLASLIGVNESNIARRIEKLKERLLDGAYFKCLRHCKKLTTVELSVAKQHFLMGTSMQEIAVLRGWSYYKIRKMILRIRSLLDI